MFIGSNGHISPDGRVPEDGRRRTRVTRYVIDREPPYTFHRDSATVLIEWDSDGHNGGDMTLGPESMMYVGSGDGTSDSDEDRVGQNLTTLRSKILRIDPDHPAEETLHDGRHYSVPKDNPFFLMPTASSPRSKVSGRRHGPTASTSSRATREAFIGPSPRLLRSTSSLYN